MTATQEPTMLADGTTYSDVIIVGTGFSGLGMAARIARETDLSFVLLERADGIGGAWRDNTYPGAACDIQSHLYCYSFRPNPDWSRVYATQPEILAYLQRTAQEEGLLPHVRLRSEVLSAQWDERDQRWVVHTPVGRYVARALVSAAGHLSDPKMPDIPGLETFSGSLFHSARWDHGARWENRRVGVIGTGASGIQVVPELAKRARQLTVFQRSAPYIVPRRDHAYSEAEKGLFRRMPQTVQELRDELFWGNEARFPQRRQVPAFLDQVRRMALSHLHAQVRDPQLRARLTPDYEIGCKRILLSNDYYPALQLPNVDLNTDGIDHVTANGVVTGTGEIVELDVLVVCTGFEAADLPIAYRLYGRDGVCLADRWSSGGQAYACTTVHGFPNLFVMLGPNTGLGAGSMIYMIETQVAYITQAVQFLAGNDASIEIPREAEDEYAESLRRRSEGTVWTAGGCASWYLDPRSGRLTTLWPDFMSRFRAENGTFDPAPYRVRQPHQQPVGA